MEVILDTVSLPHYAEEGVFLLNFPLVSDTNTTCTLISNINRGVLDCDGLFNIINFWTLSFQILYLYMEIVSIGLLFGMLINCIRCFFESAVIHGFFQMHI